MRLALLIALTMIVPLQTDFELREAIAQKEFIEENELHRVLLSCYLPTGNKTADGTVPYRGIIASNREHLGMVAVMYNNDLLPTAVWECRDIGGHKMLRDGTAIDIYVDTIEEGREIIARYNGYAYIQWFTREEWAERCESVTGCAASVPVIED